jgi:hypothetical protein
VPAVAGEQPEQVGGVGLPQPANRPVVGGIGGRDPAVHPLGRHPPPGPVVRQGGRQVRPEHGRVAAVRVG